MTGKRKRGIHQDFDPNESDSQDENFDPSEQGPRSRKKPRAGGGESAHRSRKRNNRYKGSDIEDDDEDLSDSGGNDSFSENDAHKESEDEDTPVNASGRRQRQAAKARKSYRETSDSEASVVEDSDPPAKTVRTKKVTLRLTTSRGSAKLRGMIPPTQPKRLRARREPILSQSTRRTRAHTEEHEPFMELGDSGRHARPSRASKSRSPDFMTRPMRATRGGKGVKKLPEPIEEATQETETRVESADPPVGVSVGPAAEQVAEDALDARVETDRQEIREIEDSANENDDEAAVEGTEKVQGPAASIEEDEDDGPLTRNRHTRAAKAAPLSRDTGGADAESDQPGARRDLRRGTRSRNRTSLQEPGSDYEDQGEDEGSDSENNMSDDVEESGGKSSGQATPRRGRASQTRQRAGRKGRRNFDSADEELELDQDELALEAEELQRSSRSRSRRTRKRKSPVAETLDEQQQRARRRRTGPVSYVQPTLKALEAGDEEVVDDNPIATPSRGGRSRRNGGTAGWERPINTTYGPFGGGGTGSLLGGAWGTGATVGGVDSDSSDDEMGQRSGVGGMVGMTPTSAAPPLGLFAPPSQAHNETTGGFGGAAPNVGKIKNQKAFADADPLGVDTTVDFTKVGGLQGHIDQLKEMVQLPLLYPELFLKFHVTPPRGVLFHGPPGTGKTLLARALANSVGAGGRKITFYMRKGADALSKWVGEAEKQLRLLFEEARRTQPSIIFFDEIDGLAPVRSSKQEQIHASIVSTLLALMDGMDGRGQVIVIGATNRPDNIDPALRRPGRFDREFYFPLPDMDGRRDILDIHTKDWGLSKPFVYSLAENTKGYGGADLRALCTEAALNAIQRTYPQIYSAKEKLIVDPGKIDIHATDFTISMKKLVPSSERSTTSAASPLPPFIEPLLRNQYRSAVKMLDDIFPRKKKMTALEEAMFEPYNDSDHGFSRERTHQEFERTRTFRPRLLLTGLPGMGQQYMSSAILHHLEGVHVQSFDLASLLGDGRPFEQVIVSHFTEVKRRKPSVVFIPDIEAWWKSLPDAAVNTFLTMLNTIAPTDPVLVLATSETLPEHLPKELMSGMFSFSKRNRTIICRPDKDKRHEFFASIVEHVKKSPRDFPDPAHRKRRVLEELPVAPPPPPPAPSKQEIKAQRDTDFHHLNMLKIRLQPIMDQIHRRYRKFRTPVLNPESFAYLFAEADPNYVRTDVQPLEPREFELAKDKAGDPVIRHAPTGKFYYNLDSNTIEERLANGYYARPMDFYRDINKLYLDAKNFGDRDRTLKANEIRTNVEVDVHEIEQALANQGVRFEAIHQRQLQRAKEAAERACKRQAMQSAVNLVPSDLGMDNDSDSLGPVGMDLTAQAAAKHTTAGFAVIQTEQAEEGQAGSLGSHSLTNGTSGLSRAESRDDVQMGGLIDDAPSMRGRHNNMGPPSQPLRPLTLPAPSAFGAVQMTQATTIASATPGTGYQSTGSSSNRTSDFSHRDWNSQLTNGVMSHGEDASQLPDTQPQANSSRPSQSTSSGGPWAHSQAQAMKQGLLPRPAGMLSNYDSSSSPPQPSKSSGDVTRLSNILNTPPPQPDHDGGNGNGNSHNINYSQQAHDAVSSSDPSQQNVLVMETGRVDEFHSQLVEGTSGCSIEQLEQINRELMEVLWRTRHEWNRVKVTTTLASVFNDTVRDMESIQGELQSSQEALNEDGAYVLLQ